MTNGARIGFAVVILAGAIATYFTLGQRDRIDATFCEAHYRRARTAQDSLAVDWQPAQQEREHGYMGGVLTCGELRRLAKPKRR